MKGLFRRVLCVSLAAFALMNSAACREKEQPQEEPDKFAYYPAKTDIKADGQFYGKRAWNFPRLCGRRLPQSVARRWTAGR